MNKTFDISKLTPIQLAWLAGLYQGEAAFQSDNRKRATSSPQEYTPPPPSPLVKLEMVDEDVITQVAHLLGKNVLLIKRPTRTNKQVYRVSLSARSEVEAFLLAIQPYVVGKLTQDKISRLLKLCNDYKAWVAAGGKSQAAKQANKARLQKKLG